MTFRTAEEMMEFGEQLGKKIPDGTVILLEGALGAGKTTLVKGLAKGIGIMETVTSPSFTIVSEYLGPRRLRHIDLYRTGTNEELELLGMEELLTGNWITAIEWGLKAKAFTPKDHITITIGILEDGARSLSMEGLVL